MINYRNIRSLNAMYNNDNIHIFSTQHINVYNNIAMMYSSLYFIKKKLLNIPAAHANKICSNDKINAKNYSVLRLV